MNLELELVRAYRRYVEHLAGKHNQKSHGNKYGSTDAIKANVKRLGGDKAALKSMAKRARGKNGFNRLRSDAMVKSLDKARAEVPGFFGLEYRMASGEMQIKDIDKEIKSLSKSGENPDRLNALKRAKKFHSLGLITIPSKRDVAASKRKTAAAGRKNKPRRPKAMDNIDYRKAGRAAGKAKDRYEAWDKYVIESGLKPSVDAKTFYWWYDNVHKGD